MGSGTKEKRNVTKAEAVQRLKAMASEIEEGSVHVGARTVRVPEQVRLAIKASDGELEVELKWREPERARASDDDAGTDLEGGPSDLAEQGPLPR